MAWQQMDNGNGGAFWYNSDTGEASLQNPVQGASYLRSGTNTIPVSGNYSGNVQWIGGTPYGIDASGQQKPLGGYTQYGQDGNVSGNGNAYYFSGTQGPLGTVPVAHVDQSSDPFGMQALLYGGIAATGLGAAGLGPLAAAGLGSGAGLSEGAAWGAGLGSGSADLAAMQGAVGLGGAAGGLGGFAGLPVPGITSAASGAVGGGSMFDLGGGLSVDEFGNVTGGLFQGGPGTVGAGDFFGSGGGGISSFLGSNAGSLGSLASKFLGNPALLGGLAGAALGGLSGGSKPAGMITSVQDLPDWLKPYAQANLANASSKLGQASAGASLLPGAQNQIAKTINGDYLDPNTNPALQPYAKDLMGLAGSNFLGTFGGPAGQNINNSGLQEGYTRAITNAVLPLYNQAYTTERNNQLTAATGAPNFAGQSAQSMFSPNTSFASTFPNLQTQSQPYFQNQFGNLAAGALGGAALGKAFG